MSVLRVQFNGWWVPLKFYIPTASELGKRWWIMSVFLYSFRFLSWLSMLTVWSIKVRSFYILCGHIEIIVLYQGCIELWYSYNHEIFPIFRAEYPMQWRFLIRRWILRCVHHCSSSSSVQTEIEIIEIWQSWNVIFSVIELSVTKMGCTFWQNS